jgi:hypothetical protein
MFSSLKIIARKIGGVVLAGAAALCVSILCGLALAFALILAAPLNRLRR